MASAGAGGTRPTSGPATTPAALWLGDPEARGRCRHDPHHWVPRASLEKHEAACRLRRLRYSPEEQAEMYDSSFFYEKVKIPTILMDKNLQFHIIKQATATDSGSCCPGAYSATFVEVPQNHKRSICDLTQADRLAIYNYALTETKNQRSRSQLAENDSDLFVDLAAKVNQDDGQKGPKSHLEILAEMRDYKRRRQSYRAKNVHITKKSYTEVIRDVIGVHMEELATHWQEENKNLKGCEDGRWSFSVEPSGRKSIGLHRLIPDNPVEAQRTFFILNAGRIPAEVQANRKKVRKEREMGIPEGKERGTSLPWFLYQVLTPLC